MILQKTSDLNYIPERIISLVPSQTELLHYLGLEAETVGITKFCVHPENWYKTKTRVGGTKAIKTNIIHDLKPDLIIANKEENIKEQVELLANDYPIWVSDVNNLEDALMMIKDIGELTGKKSQANSLTGKISKSFQELNQLQTTNLPTGQAGYKPKTAYLIWHNPYMTIGGDTFINDMLSKWGFENIFAHKSRYPEVTIEDMHIANCQLLLLSSEPYPFRQKHVDELSSRLPGCKILLVDGEMFSWYGSRLLLAPDYFKTLTGSMF
jgi:ABC-type Fe3+-hydroxamate transport system substrate-binding protein